MINFPCHNRLFRRWTGEMKKDGEHVFQWPWRINKRQEWIRARKYAEENNERQRKKMVIARLIISMTIYFNMLALRVADHIPPLVILDSIPSFIGPVGWGCRIHRLLLCRGVGPPPRYEWPSRGSNDAGALENAEHPFIAIAPKSTLARNDSTW